MWPYIVIAACAIVSGLAILGYQCVLWLEVGYWTELPIGNFITDNPNLNWESLRGVEKIWKWVLELPTGVSLFVVGTALMVGATKALTSAAQELERVRNL